MLSRTLISVFFLMLSVVPARADTVERFAQSMSNLYVVSIMCQDTVVPSTLPYAKAIGDFLRVDYDGGYYWMLPNVTQRISNAEVCIYRIKGQLVDYNVASNQFRRDFPGQQTPPMIAIIPHYAATESEPGTTAPVLRTTPTRPVNRSLEKF